MQAINNFNLTHPELKPGEIFIINARPGEKWSGSPIFSSMRKGKVAYTPEGKVVPDMHPIFGKFKTKKK